MRSRPTCLILNPNSGTAAAGSAMRQWALALPDVRLCVTEGPGHGKELARDAVERGERVIAGGGDGTVHEVVQGMLVGFDGDEPDADAPELGVMPLGTGNDLTRSLGIPLDPELALSALSTCVARPIDVIEVRLGPADSESFGAPIYCVNAATGGFAGRVAQDADTHKNAWGPLAYLRGGLGNLLDESNLYALELTLDEQTPLRLDMANLVVANGRFAAKGVSIAPQAELDDGLFDVVYVDRDTLATRAAISAALVVGDYTLADDVHTIRGSRLRLRSDPPVPFSFDGELSGEHSELLFTLLPRALSILTPPPQAPAAS